MKNINLQFGGPRNLHIFAIVNVKYSKKSRRTEKMF